MAVDMDRFGENLKDALKNKGLTQRKLAGLTGIGVLTINRWATGRALPNLENLAVIAKCLDVSADKLLIGVVKE